MDILEELFKAAPLVALFITLTFGYLIGKITIGRFVLGGVAGTLLVGVVVGQVGVDIDSGVKSIFFALFIYAVGFQGGPQFFGALNRRTLNILLSAVVMTVSGLLCVIAAAWLFDLDRGTAAGLAAGGLTQSSIIGTAGDAIANLMGVSGEAKKIMETNVAVGYAVTYIFGSLGPIIMVTWFFPTIMGWDIRAEAIKKANSMAGGKPDLDPGQFNAISRIVSRAYKITPDSYAIGKTVAEVNEALYDVAIELIQRHGSDAPADAEAMIQEDDIVIVTGVRTSIHKIPDYLGVECNVPEEFTLIEEHRQLLVTGKKLVGKRLKEIKQVTSLSVRRGVYLSDYKRAGQTITISPDLIVEKNDQIQLTGTPEDINRVQKIIGDRLVSPYVTDFVFFGLGMTVGMLIGLIHFQIAGIPVTIGSGAGCLVSGLMFGWLRNTHPRFASLPMGASNFLRDFGLAVFVGLVGLSAGPQAVVTIKEYGLTLLFLGIFVTLVPQIIAFFFSYYILKVKDPIEALGALVGGRSANPGFAALLSKAGNATPVFSFTVTYAVANVLLTLWGPIIVGIITKNAAG
ncbi:aspartate-alanine antiporter [Shewanella benthica]|uniref:aspartate-alanine antiporter n=1 Tax=Shewanella benthica TaxID=43661 RepID=UPI00187A50AC|nr:aspartate-alanine antiporter [Shewanella benthica]MBE7214768.1 aspartate-alanine antiporter [Shewanella benthica]MCL1063212.1 aspartate-alanine antiporter [Shewanella benthica]